MSENWITLEQLAESGLNIFDRYDSALTAFAQQGDSDLAKRLESKLFLHENFFDVQDEIIKGLRNGSSVFVGTRIYLIFLTSYLSAVENETLYYDRLVDILHISEESNGFEPFFLGFHRRYRQRGY